MGLKNITGIFVNTNVRVSRLAKRYRFLAVGTRRSPDWMQRCGWSQIEWQLTRESWERLFPG